jgi:phosphoribosylpyrophosphate synthetase
MREQHVTKNFFKGAEGCIVVVTHGVLSGPALERIRNCEGLKMLLTRY